MLPEVEFRTACLGINCSSAQKGQVARKLSLWIYLQKRLGQEWSDRAWQAGNAQK